MLKQEIAVIGGGAAGFFAAISCKTHHMEANVTIFEKTGKVLSKVKVSGGGRCNVTNACESTTQFSKKYPRGEKFLKKAFQQFDASNTISWFENRGVPLKTEEDKRIFPVSNNSQSIIDCLYKEINQLGINLRLNAGIKSIEKIENKFYLTFSDGLKIGCDKVIVASGGYAKKESFAWLEKLGHTIVLPVPSLFTFNMPGESIKELMGVVADPVQVKVQSGKLVSDGPLLITHWGTSGPAVLKLSAWGARELYDKGYDFKIQINWLGSVNENELRSLPSFTALNLSKKKAVNLNSFGVPSRLWLFLLEKAEIDAEKPGIELTKKNINKLVNTLLNDVYSVSGKTTFKEEFVTCGGISLSDISSSTMESRVCKGMYFAGEVMDIDGITGGFNFQAAWTTGFIAGLLATKE